MTNQPAIRATVALQRVTREKEMTGWYFYHRHKIGYVYGSAKSYKLFLLGSMFSQ